MKKIRTVLVGLTFALVVLSCGHEKKISLYDDHDYVEPEENELTDSEERKQGMNLLWITHDKTRKLLSHFVMRME